MKLKKIFPNVIDEKEVNKLRRDEIILGREEMQDMGD